VPDDLSIVTVEVALEQSPPDLVGTPDLQDVLCFLGGHYLYPIHRQIDYHLTFLVAFGL
jgi:hypothetical protein